MNHDLTQALETIETERINAVNDVLDAMSNLNHKYEQLMNTEVDITEEWFQQYALFYDLQNDLVSVFNESDIDEIVKSYEDIDEQCIMESTNETRPGLLKRLLEAIKNFFKKIGERISKIINWIKGSKLPKKTIDQICSEVIKSKSVITEAVDDSLHIDFPAMPGSIVKPTKLHVISKEIAVKIENGRYELHPLYTDKKSFKNVNTIQNREVNKSSASLFMLFIKNKLNIRTMLQTLINEITIDSTNIRFSEKAVELMNKISEIFEASGSIYIDDYSIDMKDLTEATKYINEISMKLSNIDIMKADYDNRNFNTFQKVIKCVERITYGCNMAAYTIRDIYMCDRKYVSSIKSLDELSDFVQSCIQAGIPSKFIAYNTWLVMSDEFDDTQVWSKSKVAPKWGQTRIVFYPKDASTEILKIAMNGAGIISNKREMAIYHQYSKCGIADKYLAKFIKCSENYCVAVMERMKVQESISDRKINIFTRELSNEYTSHPDLIRINDIHGGNIGIDVDGNLKLIDYAGR